MAEVVMADMAIGNPASLCGPALALWASFPGIHIAQFPFQVIGNCGVISLMQCSNRPEIRESLEGSWRWWTRADSRIEAVTEVDRFLPGNRIRNWRVAMRTR
jgi:hypothetical protein